MVKPGGNDARRAGPAAGDAAGLGTLLTAIVTPFDASGGLALNLVPELLADQRAAGIDGVIVAGTNGEGTSLSVRERCDLLDAVLAARGALSVVAATGAACGPDAEAVAEHAARAGAAAILALPPYFFKKPSGAGLASFFRPILRRATIPVLLYNIPQMSAVPITDGLLMELADEPRLYGVKDSSADWEVTSGFIRNHPALQIYAGSDKLALRMHCGEGAGSISGGANALPRLVAAVREAARTNAHGADAQREQDRLNRLVAILHSFPTVAVNKSIMAMRGLPKLFVRPPLIDLTPDDEMRLRELLSAAELW